MQQSGVMVSTEIYLEQGAEPLPKTPRGAGCTSQEGVAAAATTAERA